MQDYEAETQARGLLVASITGQADELAALRMEHRKRLDSMVRSDAKYRWSVLNQLKDSVPNTNNIVSNE